jgi:hypothetical protein
MWALMPARPAAPICEGAWLKGGSVLRAWQIVAAHQAIMADNPSLSASSHWVSPTP